jgi:hypothetical protein
VAGVPPAIFNCAADTVVSTANLSSACEIRPDELFQLFIHFREGIGGEFQVFARMRSGNPREIAA